MDLILSGRLVLHKGKPKVSQRFRNMTASCKMRAFGHAGEGGSHSLMTHGGNAAISQVGWCFGGGHAIIAGRYGPHQTTPAKPYT